LKDFTESMNKEIHMKALKSYYQPSTLPIAQKIIEIMAQKDYLMRLRQDLLHLVKTSDKKISDVMAAYFVNKETAVSIGEKLGTSTRTIFRYINQGISDISKRLPEIGINTITFNQLMKQYRWIRSEYNRQLGVG